MTVVTLFPTSNANDATGLTNPNNAHDDDGTNYATCAPAKNGQVSSDYAGFGFDAQIPAGSTINSVKLIYEFKVSVTNSVAIASIAYVTGGAHGSETDNATEPVADKTVTVDVTSARSWVRDDLLDATFKVHLEGRRGNSNISVTLSFDFVKVEVVYTSAPTAVTKVVTGRYKISQFVAKLVTGRNKISQFVTKNVTGRYKISEFVTKVTVRRYKITVFILKTVTGRYQIASFVIKTVKGIYDIITLSTVTKVVTGRNKISEFASKTITGRYKISQLVTKLITGRCKISQFVTKTTTGRYRINQLVTKLITGRFKINSFVTKIITGIYDITATVTKIITGRYSIILNEVKRFTRREIHLKRFVIQKHISNSID